jgi:hypothetical protein
MEPFVIRTADTTDLAQTQALEAREENANLTNSVMHIVEDLSESIEELMMPDAITAGLLIGLANMEKLQGIIKQALPKKMLPPKKHHRNLDSLLKDKQNLSR